MALPSPAPTTPVRHVLSYGGGVNTVALMLVLIRDGEPLDEAVFADAGGEVPETYEYLEIAKRYFAEHNVPFRTVANRIKGGDLYDTAWRRRVFPSALWRWSTRDFKVRPIHKYYRSLGAHINQYVGIAYDEIERMKDSKVGFITNLYPLIDRKMTRADCVRVIEEAGLPVPEKSGCYFCPFNSADRWQWLYTRHPDLFERSVALEENSKHFPDQRLTDQVFRKRASVTLREFGESIACGHPLAGAMILDPCGEHCMT